MDTKYSHIKIGKDLRVFVLSIIKERKKVPKLIDYLASLWTVAEQFKEIEKISFAQIAEILDKAFITIPKKIDWKKEEERIELTKATSMELMRTASMDSYETDYQIFATTILLQLLELKNLEGIFRKKTNTEWRNLDVLNYLERGTANYESDYEDYIGDWTELDGILHEGKYNE